MSTRMKEMERRAMADTKVIVIPEGKICDYIDGKFRNDTPEEYEKSGFNILENLTAEVYSIFFNI